MSNLTTVTAMPVELGVEELSPIPRSCVVFTPRPLADAMFQTLGDQQHATWLEPCVGGGVFLEALAAANVEPDRIRGLDVDVTPSPQDKLATTFRGKEFLRWSQSTTERFSRIIANPPYVALSRLPAAVQKAALTIGIPGTKQTIGLGANAWFAFLCASISLLQHRGSLAFLLPAAWEYADYAAPLRLSIPQLFETVEIHRCTQPLFKTVIEGSIVLVARHYYGELARTEVTPVQRASYETPDALISALSAQRPHTVSPIFHAIQVATGGCRNILEGGTNESSLALRRSNPAINTKKQLGDVIQIRLGGVTGDADYFVLSDEQRRQHDLPRAVCHPVISRARHLTAGSIAPVDWRKLRDNGERIWLFNPRPSQIRLKAVKRYLDLVPQEGGCNRTALKVRSRNPWYRTPLQRRIDGFMSGMSGWGPWVVFRETPQLAATNTLYLVQFLAGKTQDERAAWAMWLLTSEAVLHLDRIGRRYADGLVKFEPGDIAELPIDTPARTDGAYCAYQRAVRLLLNGQKSASQRLADKWF